MFIEGAQLASRPVDYINAIPDHFNSMEDAQFWQGYIAAEWQRVCIGKRNRSEFNIAQARYWQAMAHKNTRIA